MSELHTNPHFGHWGFMRRAKMSRLLLLIYFTVFAFGQICPANDSSVFEDSNLIRFSCGLNEILSSAKNSIRVENGIIAERGFPFLTLSNQSARQFSLNLDEFRSVLNPDVISGLPEHVLILGDSTAASYFRTEAAEADLAEGHENPDQWAVIAKYRLLAANPSATWINRAVPGLRVEQIRTGITTYLAGASPKTGHGGLFVLCAGHNDISVNIEPMGNIAFYARQIRDAAAAAGFTRFVWITPHWTNVHATSAAKSIELSALALSAPGWTHIMDQGWNAAFNAGWDPAHQTRFGNRVMANRFCTQVLKITGRDLFRDPVLTWGYGGDFAARDAAVAWDARNRPAAKALFGRRKNAGLKYTPQFSADLTTWETHDGASKVVAEDDLIEACELPFPVMLNGHSACFFRLVVERVTP